MEWYIAIIIGVASLLVFCTAMFLVFSVVIDKAIFGTRQDKNPDYKYFTPEEFDLTTEKIPVYYNGVILSAALYFVKPVEECGKVVIFQHGFGAGSASYMTEIAHFARLGNVVLAVDALGCNNSAGKNIKGFYAGAEAVIAAYIAVKSDMRLKSKKLALVGHSWGAYSVAAATAKVNADGVVAISGFNSPAGCVCEQLVNLVRKTKIIVPFVRGWFYIINLFKFGAKGNTKAVKALKKSGTKALLIHGEKDGAVGLKHSLASLAGGENITRLVLPDKRHNPYNTVAAEDKLAQLFNADGESGKEFYESFDWGAATEEDGAVMGEIDKFIESL